MASSSRTCRWPAVLVILVLSPFFYLSYTVISSNALLDAIQSSWDDFSIETSCVELLGAASSNELASSPLSSRPEALSNIQFDFPATDQEAEDVLATRAQIKEAFLRGWTAYKTQAWGHDEVAPIYGGYRDTHGGWAVTLVAALDTLWIMDLKADFEDAVQEVGRINFTEALLWQMPLNEISADMLGGLLGAYDVSDGQYPTLLRQARILGDLLLQAFETPNGLPTRYLQVRGDSPGVHSSADAMELSELGGLSLELTRLAQLTGDSKYYDAVTRSLKALDTFQRRTSVPGLWPDSLSASGCSDFRRASAANCTHPKLRPSPETPDDFYSLSPGMVPAYDGLLKQHLLLGQLDDRPHKMFSRASAAIKSKLLFHPYAGHGASNIQMAGNLIVTDDGGSIRHKTREVFQPLVSSASCSAAAMFVLGSRVSGDAADLQTAQQLLDGCLWAHDASRSRIMPAEFVMMRCDLRHGDPPSVCDWNADVLHAWWDRLDIRLHDGFDAQLHYSLPPRLDYSFEKRGSSSSSGGQSGGGGDGEDQVTKHPKRTEKRGPNTAPTAAAAGPLYDALLSASVTRPDAVLAHEDFVRDRVWAENLAEGMVDVLARGHDLGPATLESLFVLHRVTGDAGWRRRGRDVFRAVDRMTAVRGGNARLVDTTAASRRARRLEDTMPHRWLGATLKYAFLLFDDPAVASLDDFVFNAAGHPLRLPR